MNSSNRSAQESSPSPDIMDLVKKELGKESPRIPGSVPLKPSEYLAMDPAVNQLQSKKRDEIQELLDSGVSLADALEPEMGQMDKAA